MLKLRTTLARSVVVVLAAVGMALLCSLALPELAARIPLLAFAVAIVVVAWFGGLWPGIAAAVLSVVTIAWFLLAPRYSFNVAAMTDRAALATFLPAAWFVVWLVETMHSARRRVAASEREALLQREALRTTLASIGDAVIATDASGVVTFVNAVAEDLTGWTPEQARGRSLVEVFRIVNEETRATVANPVERALREGRIVGLANHTLLIRRDGTEVPIEDSAAPIVDGEGRTTGAVLVFRDVSAAREEEQRQAVQHGLSLLAADLGRAVSGTDDLPTMLQRCCEAYVEHLDAAFCRVWLRDPADDVLVLGASAGLYTHLDGGHARIPIGRFKIGQIAAERKAILTNGVVGDERVHDQEWARREGMVAFAGHPLLLGPRLIGVVGLFARHEFSEATLLALESNAKMLAVGIARRTSEAQVASALDYSTTIVETIREPLVVLDGDLRVRSANRSFYETFLVDRAETEGRLLYELGNGQWDIPALRRLLEEILPERTSFSDYEIRHDFEEVGQRTMLLNARQFFDNDHRTDSILLAIEDVTENRRLAREQRVTEERLATFIEQVQDYAIFMMDPDGRATSWNDGVANVLGYDEEEFLGLHVPTHIFTPEAIAEGVAAWEFATADEQGTAGDDRWMLRKDGRRFWASGITTGVHDETGRLIGFNKVMRDLTDRKLADDANRELAADLSEANRRKNEFLATLAHELRNPLAPIKNALVLMTMAEGDLPAEVEELRQLVERQVQQMVRLVDDLIDVSRINTGKVALQRGVHEIGALVRTAVESSRTVVDERGHELTVELPDEPLLVLADPARMAQVLANLLNNAAKYTPTGGRLRLVVEREGDDVRIDVADDGIGIAPEKLDEVFELFAQVDGASESGRSGLGIGLTLVRNFVELHGGTIEVASDGDGQGSCFTVRLPLTVEGVAPDKPRSAPPRSSASRRSYRLLVVEDTRAVRVTFARLLERMGHEVETAENGRDALEKVRAFDPQIVFSDISMPEMNGHELARRLRARPEFATVHLVALTGFGQSADRERAFEAGFDDHMVKPVDIAELERLFVRLEDRSLGGNAERALGT